MSGWQFRKFLVFSAVITVLLFCWCIPRWDYLLALDRQELVGESYVTWECESLDLDLKVAAAGREALMTSQIMISIVIRNASSKNVVYHWTQGRISIGDIPQLGELSAIHGQTEVLKDLVIAPESQIHFVLNFRLDGVKNDLRDYDLVEINIGFFSDDSDFFLCSPPAIYIASSMKTKRE